MKVFYIDFAYIHLYFGFHFCDAPVYIFYCFCGVRTGEHAGLVIKITEVWGLFHIR